MHLIEIARSAMAVLEARADIFRGRLLCFVSHSMGGLIVKQALRYFSDRAQREKELSTFLNAVDNVVFIATPHTGSQLATAAGKFGHLLKPTQATLSLKKNDAHLSELNDWYRDWSFSRVQHLAFYETKVTKRMGIVSCKTVDTSSSNPGLVGCHPIPLDDDHVGAAKLISREASLYTVLIRVLNKSDDLAVVKARQTGAEVAIAVDHLVDKTQKLMSGNPVRADVVDSEVRAQFEEGRMTTLFDTSTYDAASLNAREVDERARRILDGQAVGLAVQALTLWKISVRQHDGNLQARALARLEGSVAAMGPACPSKPYFEGQLAIAKTQNPAKGG